ncbi:hypothetical protein MMC11_007921 [Xylographa trunciseda]|nr:hypothetical protein [Xylographa trunciseda]
MPNQLKLVDVLGANRSLGASNPRDHVYAALSMVVDPRIKDMKPDYSLSVTDVFIDSVEWFFNGPESVFDVLGFVEARVKDVATSIKTQDIFAQLSAESQSTESLTDLPSWVPDWTATYTHIPFLKKAFLGNANSTGYYTASGAHSILKPKISLGDSRRTLEVDGFAVDVIEKLSTPGLNQVRTDHAIEMSWKAFIPEGVYFTGESMNDVYLRTVVADMTYLYNIDRRRGGKMQWNGTEQFGTALKCATFGRCFAITRNRYMGLVRKDVNVGDQVFVLLGGEVLYVLRPHEDHHLFMGECYMHGLMDGEAMEWLKDGRAALKRLRIR